MNWSKTCPMAMLVFLLTVNDLFAAPAITNLAKVLPKRVYHPHPSQLMPEAMQVYNSLGYHANASGKVGVLNKILEIQDLKKRGVSLRDEALRRGKLNLREMLLEIHSQHAELKQAQVVPAIMGAILLASFSEDIKHFDEKLHAPLKEWTNEVIGQLIAFNSVTPNKKLEEVEARIQKIFADNIEASLKITEELLDEMMKIQKMRAAEWIGNPFEGNPPYLSDESYQYATPDIDHLLPRMREYGPFEDPGIDSPTRFQMPMLQDGNKDANPFMADPPAPPPPGGAAPDKGDGGRDPLEITGKGAPIPPHPRRQNVYEEFLEERTDISASVKVKWGPASVEGGTTLEFKRKTAMKLLILGPGEDPIVHKKQIGERMITRLNHNKDRRFVYFCEFEAQAVNSLLGSGRLKFETPDIPISPVSVRGEISAGHAREGGERVQVVQTTLVKYVPILQANGTETSYTDVVELCRKQFNDYKDKVYKELQLTLSELTYHNSQNQCVKDAHCEKWHSKMIPGVVYWTNPRCTAYKEKNAKGEETGGTVKYCRLRSKKYGACSWYKNGKLSTAGMFEYPCDEGLTCVLTYNTSSWNIFESDKARCE